MYFMRRGVLGACLDLVARVEQEEDKVGAHCSEERARNRHHGLVLVPAVRLGVEQALLGQRRVVSGPLHGDKMGICRQLGVAVKLLGWLQDLHAGPNRGESPLSAARRGLGWELFQQKGRSPWSGGGTRTAALRGAGRRTHSNARPSAAASSSPASWPWRAPGRLARCGTLRVARKGHGSGGRTGWWLANLTHVARAVRVQGRKRQRCAAEHGDLPGPWRDTYETQHEERRQRKRQTCHHPCNLQGRWWSLGKSDEAGVFGSSPPSGMRLPSRAQHRRDFVPSSLWKRCTCLVQHATATVHTKLTNGRGGKGRAGGGAAGHNKRTARGAWSWGRGRCQQARARCFSTHTRHLS